MSTPIAHDPVQELLTALEADWLDPSAASEADIEALLARRQEILDRLQSLDASAFTDAAKETYRARLAAVHARDQALLATLQQRLGNIAEQQTKAVNGRAAVRGYRAPEDDEAKLFIRPA